MNQATTTTTRDGGGNGNDNHQFGSAWNQKKAAVEAELSRIRKLPANSTYAVHRLRVLNKIHHLLSIQRSRSQEEELELIFAGLSL